MTVTVSSVTHWDDPSDQFRCFSSVCGPGCCGRQNGWAVPYTRRGKGETTYQPVVYLYVTDLSEGATFSAFLPFVIDTGAAVTMIPRALLGDRRAFRSKPVGGVYRVTDVSGDVMLGRRFLTGLSVTPRRSECDALTFRPLPIVVLDPDPNMHRPIQLGLLGLDALRQVVTVFDLSHACFRERVDEQSAAQASA